MYIHVLPLNEKEEATLRDLCGLNVDRVAFISKTELMNIPRIPNLYLSITHSITTIPIPSNITGVSTCSMSGSVDNKKQS